MENNELLLSLAIYSRHSIIAAIKAYQSLTRITLAETSDAIIVHFNNCKYDTTVTKFEFNNYLINLENTRIE